MPRFSPAPESRSAWLAQHLQQLLAAPHIHMSDEEGAMMMGPGPVDMFSTVFDQMFAPDARGWVCGNRADRQELKESLIGLQRRWNEKEVVCKGCTPHESHAMEFHPDMAAKMEFTPLFMYPAHHENVMAEARGIMVEGQERIAELMLEGDPVLFRHE